MNTSNARCCDVLNMFFCLEPESLQDNYKLINAKAMCECPANANKNDNFDSKKRWKEVAIEMIVLWHRIAPKP
jgi:hypothetical protein